MRTTSKHVVSVAVLAIASVCALSNLAGGRTFHVSPTGSNTPPYDTYAKAAHEVTNAVRAASGYGDTVLIHAGDYDIDTTINLPKGLSLQGDDADSTKLVWHRPYSSSGGLMFHLSGDHEISHLSFVNAEGASYQRVLAVIASIVPGSITISHCLFNQTEIFGSCWVTFAVYENYFEVGSGRGVTTLGGGIMDVHHNTFSGGREFDTPTCFLANGSQILLRDNVFDLKANAARGYGYAVDAEYSSGGPLTVRNNLILGGREAFAWWYHEGTIENNTIIGASYRAGGAILESFQTLIIRNNAIVNCGGVLGIGVCTSCGPGAKFEITHNAFWPPVNKFHTTQEPSYFVTVVDSANFNAYPMFADDSLYHLQRGSPLIDAGDQSLNDTDSSRSDVGRWGGPGGSSDSYLELAPLPPDSLWDSYADHVASLSWSARPEADLAGYRLYRGDEPGFWSPGMPHLKQINAAVTHALDTIPSAMAGAYYVVTAVDTTGRESGPSPELVVMPTDIREQDTTGSALPLTPAIKRTYPNPFNASTVIEVTIPAVGASPAPVEISVFNTLGQRVGTAFRGSLSPGVHPIEWQALDGAERPLATGVYFVRLRVWSAEFGSPVKVVILR